jgi:hypothetical protein
VRAGGTEFDAVADDDDRVRLAPFGYWAVLVTAVRRRPVTNR